MAHKEYNSLAGARLECWLYILAKFGAVIFVHFLLNPPKKNTLTASVINCVRGNSHFSHFGRKGVR